MIINYLYMILIAIVVIYVLKVIFKFGPKLLKSLLLNALSGTIILWILNYFHIVSIPINIISVLVTGFLGVPGVVILLILKFMGVI